MSDYLRPDMPMSWRLDKAVAGTGTFGDLGSHHIDTARFLIGEIAEVMAIARVNVPEVAGHRIEVDDAFASIVTFENGMVGTIQASRVAAGYGHYGSIEVDCTGGSLRYQVGKLNELQIAEGRDQGFRTIQVIKPEHPLADFWWDGGVQGSHPIGWVECFVHQVHHFVGAVIGRHEVSPLAATFRDGYRVAESRRSHDRIMGLGNAHSGPVSGHLTRRQATSLPHGKRLKAAALAGPRPLRRSDGALRREVRLR